MYQPLLNPIISGLLTTMECRSSSLERSSYFKTSDVIRGECLHYFTKITLCKTKSSFKEKEHSHKRQKGTLSIFISFFVKKMYGENHSVVKRKDLKKIHLMATSK